MNIDNIPQLGATDGEKIKTAYLHFTELFGRGEWYVCEAEVREDDIIFFGFVELFEKEWGPFSLNELKSVPTIFLDEDFIPQKINFKGELLG